ncbi:MAG: DUF6768 family protein [Planctomycetota bacterium]|jgi:hypothetical protein
MEEPTLWKLVGEVFRGKKRLYATLVWIMALVFLAIAILAATRMCQAEEAKGVVLWATTFLSSLIILMAVKIWFWLEMAKVELRLTLGREP